MLCEARCLILSHQTEGTEEGKEEQTFHSH